MADIDGNNHDPTPDTASGLGVLRHLIEEQGMKQADLAKVLGVGQSAVSTILSGDRPITADHARRLGKRFAVDPGVLL